MPIIEHVLLIGIISYIVMFDYLNQAEQRGMSDTVVGWVFGVYALVQFLTSPLFGKMVSLSCKWNTLRANIPTRLGGIFSCEHSSY